MVLRATEHGALEFCALEDLKRYAVDLAGSPLFLELDHQPVGAEIERESALGSARGASVRPSDVCSQIPP